MRNQLQRQPLVSDAAHLVAVPAIVADHLRALVRDMLRDGGQEVGGGEDLEVAVDLGIEAGAVDHHVGRGLQRHFLHGEGIPQDVMGQNKDVSTTQIYTHVMAKPGLGVRSPLDEPRNTV